MVEKKTKKITSSSVKVRKSGSGKVKSAGKDPKVKTSTAGLNIPVYNLSGKEEKTVSLPKELFEVKASSRLIAQYVRVYLANQRQGTHSTKHRGEIVGTTKKVYRQKGTGNARHGSAKAPLFIGGGVDGGPKPTDHSLKINKKQKQRALLSVLSSKLKENAIAAIGKDIVEMTPKTKSILAMLKTIGVENKKVMFVVARTQEGMKLSVRNLKKVDMVSISNLNAYSLLMNEKVLFSEEALTQLSSLYQPKVI